MHMYHKITVCLKISNSYNTGRSAILWACSSIAHMQGWPKNKMVAPINVLAFAWRYHHWRSKCQRLQVHVHTAAYKSLPQSAVVIAMRSNYFKVKWSKVRIVLLLTLLLQPAQCVQHLKQPPTVRKFPSLFHLSFVLSVTKTYHQRFFAGKTEGQSVLDVGRHLLVHMLG